MKLTLPTDGHLAAHAGDFLVPLEEVLSRVAAAIPADAPVGVPFVVAVHAEVPLGRSRCVPAVGRRTWWDFRAGRTIPSHLVADDPLPVNVVTAWLQRDHADTVEVLTVYPGGQAPREIHDPELPEAERAESTAFWQAHALVAAEPPSIHLVNALSLNMLGGMAEGASAVLRVRRVPIEHARALAVAATSAVGHPDTAALFAAQLGQLVPVARTTLSLTNGDRLIAGQYVGPRLPSPASELPPGAHVAWFWVEVEVPAKASPEPAPGPA